MKISSIVFGRIFVVCLLKNFVAYHRGSIAIVMCMHVIEVISVNLTFAAVSDEGAMENAENVRINFNIIV